LEKHQLTKKKVENDKRLYAHGEVSQPVFSTVTKYE